MSEMQKKKMGDHDFASEIKRVENYPDFDKLYVIQYGIQGFTAKNIEGESTKANDLIIVIFCEWVCCVNYSNC